MHRQFSLTTIETNGVTLRAAVEGDGPLVILVHGWPELWYSRRHQIKPIAEAGFRVVAPDLRGYGGSDKPEAVEAYDMATLMADVVGIIDGFGEASAILIGHDWGAINSWQFVQLHPECVERLIIMSVPLRPVADVPPIEFLRGYFKDQFFYQIYFQDRGVAEAEFDADPEGILRALYCSPDTPRHPPLLGKSLSEGGG